MGQNTSQTHWEVFCPQIWGQPLSEPDWEVFCRTEGA